MIRFLRDIRGYIPYIGYASVSEMKADVIRSYLSWLWWFLDPLCFMLVYMFIGGVVYNSSAEYFPLFIMIGITLWNMFSKSCTASVKLIRSNIKLIQQVYLPKPVLVMVKIQTNVYRTVCAFIIIIVMMIVYQLSPTIYTLNLIPILLVAYLITFAVSVWLMHFGVYVADFENMIGIVLRLVFYVSGIFYSIPDMLANRPELACLIMRVDPFAYLIHAARNALLYALPIDYSLLAYWAVIGFVVAALGVMMVYRHENGYAKVVQ